MLEVIARMKGKYKRVQTWCDHCDGDMVAPGKKCKNCGYRQTATKIKKGVAMRACLMEELEGALIYEGTDPLFQAVEL